MPNATQQKSGRWSTWRWLVVSVSLCVLLFGGALSIYRMRHATKLWEKHFNSAAIKARNGDTAGAIEGFRASLVARPSHLDTYIQLSRVYTSRHEYDAARGVIAEGRKAAQAKDGSVGESAVDSSPATPEEKELNVNLLDLQDARVLIDKARYDLQTPPASETVMETTDKTIAGPLSEALKVLTTCAARLAKPQDAFMAQAEVANLMADCYRARRDYLRVQGEKAAAMGKPIEVERARVQERARILKCTMQAFDAYQRAKACDSDAVEPRVALANWYLDMRSTPERAVLSQFDGLPPAAREKPDVKRAIIHAYFINADYAKVVEATQGMKAGDDVVMAMRAEALLNLGRAEEAWTLIEPMAARNPNSQWIANYLKGYALVLLGHHDEAAVAALQKLYSVDPKNRNFEPTPLTRYELAMGLLAMGNREQAVAAFRQAVADAKAVETQEGWSLQLKDVRERHDVWFNASQRLVTLLADDPAAALDYAQEAVRMKPQDDDCWVVALNAYDAYKPAAEARLTALEGQAKAQEETGRRFDDLARTRIGGLMQLGSWTKAESFTKEVRDQGKIADQAAIIRFLADGLNQGGYPARALSYYQDLFRQDNFDDPGARTEYAAILLRTGQNDEATAQAQKVLETQRNDKTALGLLAESYFRRGMLPEAIASAERLYEIVERDDPAARRPSAAIYLENLYRAHRDYDKAVAVDQKLCADYPAEIAFEGRLVNAYAAKNDWDAVKKTADLIVDRWPDRPEGYLMSLIYLRDNQPEKALAAFKKGSGALKGGGLLDLLSGLVLHVEGKPDEAIQQFDQVVQRPPDEETWQTRMLARLMLANVYAGEGQLDKAKALNIGTVTENAEDTLAHTSLLESISSLPPEQRRAAAIGLNRLLAWGINQWPDLQLKEAQSLAAMLPQDIMVATWCAMFKSRAGQVDGAINDLQALLQKAPDNASIKFLIARQYMILGRQKDAVPLLEQLTAAKDLKVNVLFWRELGATYQALGRFGEAVAAYEQAWKAADGEFVARNQAAWLIGVTNRPPKDAANYTEETAKAVRYAKEAVARAPDNPDVNDTLGWLLHLDGNDAEAVRFLEAARNRNPAQPVIRYHLGIVYYAADSSAPTARAKATAELQEALSLGQNFDGSADAQALLRRIEGGG